MIYVEAAGIFEYFAFNSYLILYNARVGGKTNSLFSSYKSLPKKRGLTSSFRNGLFDSCFY